VSGALVVLKPRLQPCWAPESQPPQALHQQLLVPLDIARGARVVCDKGIGPGEGACEPVDEQWFNGPGVSDVPLDDRLRREHIHLVRLLCMIAGLSVIFLKLNIFKDVAPLGV
jgi:hypothetical protein